MPTSPTNPRTPPLNALTDLLDSLDGDTFSAWYDDYQHQQNIQDGTPYYNHNDYVPDADRHSPSQLRQCHRKLMYRQLNAPREEDDSDGIFYLGDQLEDLVEEFLVELAEQHGLYIQNGMYIDYTDASESPAVRFKGNTDPVVCSRDGLPVIPTEVKSKSESAMEYLDSASTRHRAQAHAYVKGLNDRLDTFGGGRELTEYAIIYIARETLEVRVFVEEFSGEFWESVVAWARRHTEYRAGSEEVTAGDGGGGVVASVDGADDGGGGSVSWLPPAAPLEDWECEYCAYQQRCGRDDTVIVEDLGARGFLPLTEYSRSAVEAHVEAYPGVAFTPTLAYQYPELLADGRDVLPWVCRECGDVPLDRVGWDGDVDDPPTCPRCGECSLRGPVPAGVGVRDGV